MERFRRSKMGKIMKIYVDRCEYQITYVKFQEKFFRFIKYKLYGAYQSYQGDSQTYKDIRILGNLVIKKHFLGYRMFGRQGKL